MRVQALGVPVLFTIAVTCRIQLVRKRANLDLKIVKARSHLVRFISSSETGVPLLD